MNPVPWVSVLNTLRYPTSPLRVHREIAHALGFPSHSQDDAQENDSNQNLLTAIATVFTF